MIKPNFKDIKLDLGILNNTQVADTSTVWETPEKIAVKGIYTTDDIKNAEHLDFGAGIARFGGRKTCVLAYCPRLRDVH